MPPQERPRRLTDLHAINKQHAARLRDAGIETPEHVAAATVEQLASIDGISEPMAKGIKRDTDHIRPSEDAYRRARQLDRRVDKQRNRRRLWVIRVVVVALFLTSIATPPNTVYGPSALIGFTIGVSAVYILIYIGLVKLFC